MPYKIKNSIEDILLISFGAAAWQIAFNSWGERWEHGPASRALGSLLTGAADMAVTVSYRFIKFALMMVCQRRCPKIDAMAIREFVKANFFLWVLSSLWQPLVDLGSLVPEHHDWFAYIFPALFLFVGNMAFASLMKHFFLIRSVDPLFIAFSELGFYVTGPLNLPDSSSGLNRRNIRYAAAFTFTFGLVCRLAQVAFKKYKQRKRELNPLFSAAFLKSEYLAIGLPEDGDQRSQGGSSIVSL